MCPGLVCFVASVHSLQILSVKGGCRPWSLPHLCLYHCPGDLFQWRLTLAFVGQQVKFVSSPKSSSRTGHWDLHLWCCLFTSGSNRCLQFNLWKQSDFSLLRAPSPKCSTVSFFILVGEDSALRICEPSTLESTWTAPSLTSHILSVRFRIYSDSDPFLSLPFQDHGSEYHHLMSDCSNIFLTNSFFPPASVLSFQTHRCGKSGSSFSRTAPCPASFLSEP